VACGARPGPGQEPTDDERRRHWSGCASHANQYGHFVLCSKPAGG